MKLKIILDENSNANSEGWMTLNKLQSNCDIVSDQRNQNVVELLVNTGNNSHIATGLALIWFL